MLILFLQLGPKNNNNSNLLLTGCGKPVKTKWEKLNLFFKLSFFVRTFVLKRFIRMTDKDACTVDSCDGVSLWLFIFQVHFLLNTWRLSPTAFEAQFSGMAFPTHFAFCVCVCSAANDCGKETDISGCVISAETNSLKGFLFGRCSLSSCSCN